MFFSLRNRLFLVFTCLLTIPFIILSIIIPSWFTTIIEEQTEDLTVGMMDQYALYIDSITTQAEDLGKQVLVNNTTQEWLKLVKQGTANEESLLLKTQLNQLLSSMMINNSHEMSISVQLNDGTGTWGNNPSLPETGWFQDFNQNKQPFVKSHIDPFQQSQEMRSRKVNSYILPLVDTNTLFSSGIIKVNIPSAMLETAINKITIGQNGRAYLLNQQGTNVLSGKIATPNEILEYSLAQITNNDNQEGLVEAAYQMRSILFFFKSSQ